MEKSPLICRLTAPELRERKKTVIAQLKGLLKQRTLIENGYEYVFPGTDEVLALVADFIKTERLCCDFFTFRLEVPSNSQTLTLHLSGPSGTQEFIDLEIGF